MIKKKKRMVGYNGRERLLLMSNRQKLITMVMLSLISSKSLTSREIVDAFEK